MLAEAIENFEIRRQEKEKIKRLSRLMEEKEKQRQERIFREEIARKLDIAQKNLSMLLQKRRENTLFRKYLKKLLESRSLNRTRGGCKFTADEDLIRVKNTDAVLILASEKSDDMSSTRRVVIVLTIPKANTVCNDLTEDVKETRLEILTQNLDSSIGYTTWETCSLYYNQDLDHILQALAEPKSAIQFLVQQFGDVK